MGALSYVKGGDSPLLETTIDEIVSAAAARFKDREALVSLHQNVRLTWCEFDEEVERTARGLVGLGLRPLDRVGVWSGNCVEWVLLQLACARAGLVLVNVNPAYRSHDLGFVLRKSRMRALFLWPRDLRADYRSILEEASAGQELALEHVIWLGTDSWRRMLDNGRPLGKRPTTPHSPANIQYTSGTTGVPKGVLLTHRNIVNNAWLTGGWLGITEQDRVCNQCPLYHCSGSVVSGLAALIRGAALILPSAQFDPVAVLGAVEGERGTILGGVPTMFMAELEHPEFPRFDLSSLRTAWMGGAPCPVELLRRVKEKMRCRDVLILYGLTETAPIITMTRPEDPFERSAATVGRVMPNTEVKIVSLQNGETLPVGEVGELCARGYLVMPGYDGEPEATRKTIDAEGWLHTGDLALLDSDGMVQITGRAKEMIIRGGENISPREIEEFLYTHPKIAQVAVFGMPDRRLGEVVAAWVRAAGDEFITEDEIREFCHDRIAHFKVPRYIRFVDSFPTTASGKVQKFLMRQMEVEGWGRPSEVGEQMI